MKLVVGMLCGALVVGCSNAHTPPGPDSSTCTAGGAGCGLFVPWSVNPAIPGTIAGSTTIETATFRMSSLRVIGDADPGDSLTTASSFVVAWAQDAQPSKLAFAAAPSGLYSNVSIAIDGAFINDSYLITGHAQANGTTYPYTIHDAFAISVDLATSTQLDPGGASNIPIEIDLASCVGAVDWNLVHLDNGVLNLDTDDEWIPTFRQKLIASFSVAVDH